MYITEVSNKDKEGTTTTRYRAWCLEDEYDARTKTFKSSWTLAWYTYDDDQDDDDKTLFMVDPSTGRCITEEPSSSSSSTRLGVHDNNNDNIADGDSKGIISVAHNDDEDNDNAISYNYPKQVQRRLHTIQMFYLHPPTIFRVHRDHKVKYGDGGRDNLFYPIWVTESLEGMKEFRRRRVVGALHQLCNQRQDYQLPRPVQDIIDPDLFPQILPDYTTWLDSFKKRNKQALDKKDRGDEVYQQMREFTRIELHENEVPLIDRLRSTYQWVPSTFIIHPDRRVEIASPIHNLPVLPEYKQLYYDIAHIFSSMVPLFERLGVIKYDKQKGNVGNGSGDGVDQNSGVPSDDQLHITTTRLQVVVKAQSYLLEPGMSYAGRWHTEGYTENIIGSGVYYAHVDDALEGGALKFRPAHAPQPWYDIPTDVEVDVHQGAAIAFANTIPHRFRKITNNTSSSLRRTFLNFFIVDPLRPITLTHQKVDVSRFVSTFLSIYVAKLTRKHFPHDLILHILSYIPPGNWQSVAEAKKFRQQVRDSMVTSKTGWGWINWGNCGNVSYVPSFPLWSNSRRDYENFVHTESE
eukprot:TRINITY_DN10470_c0_g3_i1.p1 TRINITY_DN10470_c0_g3~~TRINITY_DN10470_c0_g3_i1.p1  ORF type:complete len:622 (+),score=111.44 TRINITY_DN10470_c0_g3_i1:136-1866(+)